MTGEELFATAPCSRVNKYFTTVIQFMFNCRGEQMIKHIYKLRGLCRFLSACCAVKCGHAWATGVWLVLVWTGPSCPRAHSRLIIVIPFCWLGCLQKPSLSFQRVLFGLDALIQVLGAAGIGFGFLATHMHIYHRRIGYKYRHIRTSNAHIHIVINAIMQFDVGWSVLLTQTPLSDTRTISHSGEIVCW